MVIQPKLKPLGDDPASLERVRVRTHDEIDSTAAGNTVTVQVVQVKNVLLGCGLLIGPRNQWTYFL